MKLEELTTRQLLDELKARGVNAVHQPCEEDYFELADEIADPYRDIPEGEYQYYKEDFALDLETETGNIYNLDFHQPEPSFSGHVNDVSLITADGACVPLDEQTIFLLEAAINHRRKGRGQILKRHLTTISPEALKGIPYRVLMDMEFGIGPVIRPIWNTPNS